MNGKISQKSGKIFVAHLTLRVAAFCLAVCVSVFAFGRSVEAAPSITTYNGDFATGLVGVRYVNKDGAVVASGTTASGDNWRHFYTVPMGVSYTLNTNSTGSHIGKYISGFFSVDLETSWSTSSGTVSKTDYNFEGTSNSGEGWTTGFYYNNDTYDVSVYLILDNYPLTYTDASQTHFRVDVTNTFSVVSTSQTAMGIYGCNLTHPGLNDYVLTTSPDADLASVIAAGINASSDVNTIISTLNAIKTNTSLLSSVAEKLDVTNTAIQQIVTNITTENSAFYWLLVNAIKNANDSQTPSVKDEVVQDMENIGNSMESGESIEQDLVADMNTGLSGIDFNFISAAPTTVAGAAPWVVGLIYNVWSYMGPLQYLMTCALTLGLVFVLLASINKKNKS